MRSISRVVAAVFCLAVLVWSNGLRAQDGGSAPVPQVRGVLEAPEVAVLSAEVPGRLAVLDPREGEVFAQGDDLARFDCAILEAQKRAAEATLRRANLELGSRNRLAKLGSMGKLDVGIASAEAAVAQAEVDLRSKEVENCVVRAPFDGWVVARRANAHEVLSPGEPLLEIVSTGRPTIRMVVPSAWLKWMSVGWSLSFTVDETGATLPAEVIRLGAQVDPVSQTVPVFARVTEAAETEVMARIRPGMSGAARFRAPMGGDPAQ